MGYDTISDMDLITRRRESAMADNQGRNRRISSGGTGLHKRGSGLNTGPVGRTDGYSGRTGSSSSGSGRPSGTGHPSGGGGRRSSGGGGMNPITLIIVVVIALLGGGGGLGALLGGGSGSSSSGSSGSSSYTSTQHTGGSSSGTHTSSQYSGSGSYGQSTYGGSSGSSSLYGNYSSSGTGGGLQGLLNALGSSSQQTLTGTYSNWEEGSNTGTLNTATAPEASGKFTKLKGNGKDTVTIMIYMCGTDLESKSSMATSDIVEMSKATLSDKVNVILYTGGCTKWKNNIISSSTNQIYQVKNGGLQCLVSNDGDRTMTDPETLTRFIKWCAKNFPANRNELIMWDHGGGSVSGYGYDQKHARAGSMSLPQIKSAIKNSGQTFDFIGFDACLMATAETALAVSDSADYLLASEETEPGTGWYYTNWLTSLSSNTSMPTTELGKKIIDDFVDVSARQCRGQSTTLSLVDLSELKNTFPDSFSEFADGLNDLLDSKNYTAIATARKKTREFARTSRINQYDLVHLAKNLGTDEARQLADTCLSAIKYNRTSSDMTNSYGLAVYFPSQSKYTDSMTATYKALELSSSYANSFRKIAAVQDAGQAVSGGGTLSDLFGSLTGSSSSGGSISDLLGGSGGYSSSGGGLSDLLGGSGGYYSSGGGLSDLFGSSGGYSSGSSLFGSSSSSDDMMMDMLGALFSGRSLNTDHTTEYIDESGYTEEDLSEMLSGNVFNGYSLKWTQQDGRFTMQLPMPQWSLVDHLERNVFYDDGEGYIDLGLDNSYTISDDGTLTAQADRYWISIDGHPVAYYHITSSVTDEGTVSIGRVPCYLNDDRCNLILIFDAENPYGYVAGASFDYINGETDTIPKSMTSLKDGDVIDFVCDYYNYDQEYDNTYLLDQMVVDGEPEITDTYIGDDPCFVTYLFTDIYGREYWSDPVWLS